MTDLTKEESRKLIALLHRIEKDLEEIGQLRRLLKPERSSKK